MERELGVVAARKAGQGAVQGDQGNAGHPDGDQCRHAAGNRAEVQERPAHEALGGAHQARDCDLLALGKRLHAHRVEYRRKHHQRDARRQEQQADAGKTQERLQALNPGAVQLHEIDPGPLAPGLREGICANREIVSLGKGHDHGIRQRIARKHLERLLPGGV